MAHKCDIYTTQGLFQIRQCKADLVSMNVQKVPPRTKHTALHQGTKRFKLCQQTIAIC
jgi:hypothetical protein